MKIVKLVVLMLATACLFSACTVYHQDAPKSSPSQQSGPEQKM
ncbi:hypothetical protein [Candidatus Electronema sp. PJ]